MTKVSELSNISNLCANANSLPKLSETNNLRDKKIVLGNLAKFTRAMFLLRRLFVTETFAMSLSSRTAKKIVQETLSKNFLLSLSHNLR